MSPFNAFLLNKYWAQIIVNGFAWAINQQQPVGQCEHGASNIPVWNLVPVSDVLILPVGSCIGSEDIIQHYNNNNNNNILYIIIIKNL